MLFGINTPRQIALAKRGMRIRCLISYGEFWFPWYMRRLAERPANVGFVIRNMFKG
jgi:proline dehydrogenase